MFKKSLAAVAVLGAFAASSFAADVTFYGKVDAGLKYMNTETTGFDNKTVTSDDFTLDSGVGQASRFGIKATEDLGNGYKVSFKLENGFKDDTGAFNDSSRLFDREASLTVTSDWGSLIAGRIGSFSVAASQTDVIFARGDALDGGHFGNGLVALGRIDNTLAYQSPKIAGFQATGIYSFKMDGVKGEGEEGHSSADRYAAFGVTYDIGALQTAIGYEQVLRNDKAATINDAKLIHFGGNYDFDLFKLYVMGQYFEGMDKAISSDDVVTAAMNKDGIDGYGLHLGAQFDALAGHFDTAFYYVDATANGEKDRDGEYFGITGRYIYDLSKRTNIRVAAQYSQTTWDKIADTADFEKDTYGAYVALTHNF